MRRITLLAAALLATAAALGATAAAVSATVAGPVPQPDPVVIVDR
jgi:hypothetical protein